MITSVQNNQVKYLSKLNSRSKRYEKSEYLVYGKTLVSEAQKKGVVKELFSSDENLKDATLVSQEVLSKIVGGANTQIAALCKMEKTEFDSGDTLILDNIQDPGNLGTILRSAKAFGINNVYLGEGTVDLYNEKVLRSMQGVNYYLNIKNGNIFDYLDSSPRELITTFLDEESTSFSALDNSSAFDIIFGNEGHGLNQEIKKYKRKNIILDIEFESLNVAIAASIMMYKLREIK